MRGMQLSPGAGSPPGPPDLEDDEGLKHLQQVWGGGWGWAVKTVGTLPCRRESLGSVCPRSGSHLLPILPSMFRPHLLTPPSAPAPSVLMEVAS